MVKRLSSRLLRATISISDKMLTYRLAQVFGMEALVRIGCSRSSVATLAGNLNSAFNCAEAASMSHTACTTDGSRSGCHLATPWWNLNQQRENLDSSSSRRSQYCSADVGPNGLFNSWRSSALSSFSRPVYQSSCFATAAINILDPGRSWRGKGWHRVIVQEPGCSETEASASSQFDCIRDLDEKLKFLETCGLGDSQLEQMRKRLPSAVKNTFLKLSVKKLIEVATFMEEEVGVRKKDFGNVLFANPYIAGSSVNDCLRPKILFLRERGISKEQMEKMVARFPQVLTYSLEGKLLAIEQKLLGVGLKGDEVVKVFLKYPAVFGTSLSKFDKNVQALKDGGITEVAKAIFKLPQIMSLSLDNKFEQIMCFLRDELKLQQEQVTKMLSCQICILSFSVQENIRPKVGYFAEMGLQQGDIARMVMKYPNLFCHSLDNSIKPKVQYLMEVMDLQVMELLSFPHYLSYSLADCIIPRHEYVINHGFTFRLSSLLSCCESVFQKRFPKRQDALGSLLEQTSEQHSASISTPQPSASIPILEPSDAQSSLPYE